MVLVHKYSCRKAGTRRIKTGTAYEPDGRQMSRNIYGKTNTLGRECGYGDEGGMETVDAWECAEGCAVKGLDEQSGILRSGKDIHPTIRPVTGFFGSQMAFYSARSNYGDSGGASRFFKQVRTGFV